MSNSKTIAKNTLFLYFRMFLIMGVTLYTSRVVLQQLGISDFGIYSLVGGIVATLGFFNAAMSSATQRYLSFDIGKGDEQKLQKTFSATLTIHILIAVLALILAETIGLWYINYKMVFPENRLYAVNVVYQFSVLTFLLGIIQVPYNALIIARERMKVYAYVSILEAGLKLAIVFLLVLGEDKLILYSILTFFVALIIRLVYQFYCRKQFEESKYRFDYDKKYFTELMTYSGWNLFGNFAAVARGQGVNMVLNLFFGTVINAAYGITMQIQGAVQMFVTNFQMAVNPQIIKTYATGNLKEMRKLVFQSSRLSYYLLLILIVPLILHTNSVLELWLGVIPENTVVFVRLVLIGLLLDSISGPLMIAVQATGKVKWYQIILGTFIFLNLPISYLALLFGGKDYYVFIVFIIITFLTLVFRMFFLKSILGFSVYDFCSEVLLRIFVVSLVLVGVYKIIMLRWNLIPFKPLVFFELGISFLIEFMIIIIVVISVGTNGQEKRFLTKRIIKNER
ncbi:lipopolysaccharide biosynthesis protein [Myroides odoratimimus]|uniref:lipopolysaccharide biosynthesis protein n=1 Tax=Myroides odoratimimus TaxID=76832 RepID=UPI001CE1A0AC|nr:oligosaccharide flippase family protein [Myroides odoratimimus]MCA4806989.1 oligosaccharide flippase family protein [Myroides odoratimimus]